MCTMQTSVDCKEPAIDSDPEDELEKEQAELETSCHCVSEDEEETDQSDQGEDENDRHKFSDKKHPPWGDGKQGGASEGEGGCPDATYRLHAVVSHVGGLASNGHYISDVCDPDSGEWLRLDDDVVTRRWSVCICMWVIS